jgi:hypothetical protein
MLDLGQFQPPASTAAAPALRGAIPATPILLPRPERRQRRRRSTPLDFVLKELAMAARQDQTLIIVNILCVIFALGGLLGMYLGLRAKGEAEQQLASVNATLTGEQQRARNLQTENEQLRETTGFGAQEAPDKVQEAFQADMAKYVPGQPTNATSYRQALVSLYERYKATETSEATAKEQVRDMQARLDAQEAAKDAQIAEAEKARKAAVDTAAAQQAEFNATRARIEEERVNLIRSVEQQKTYYETQIAQRNAQIAQLQAEVEKRDKSITGLLERVKPPAVSLEVPDGEISWVTQTGTVWINLGSADALRPLVTFSVYDADATNAANAKEKGTIEVTRILDQHLAEARVTSDDPRDPIIKGDRIYSPAWHRGRPMHFAFTGVVDVNDDGQSDLQLVRNLVTLNGGVVDAYLSEEGNVEGAMSVATRYLVLGRAPASVLQSKQAEGWQAMTREATALGIETITLDQFLDQMGYRAESRAVQLGDAARARDFPAQQYTDAATAGAQRTPARFRQREPETTEPAPPPARPR